MRIFAFLMLVFLSINLRAQPNPVQMPQSPADMMDIPAGLEELAEPPVVPGGAVTTSTGQSTPQLPPEMTDPLLEGFFEDVGYSPADKRDPFLPYLTPAQRLAQGPSAPLEPLQKFALSELKLVGIIWDVGTPKALIEDPTGKSHIIIENTKMGQERGYVAAIREGEVIVVEQLISQEGQKSFQTKVLKLSALAGRAK